MIVDGVDASILGMATTDLERMGDSGQGSKWFCPTGRY